MVKLLGLASRRLCPGALIAAMMGMSLASAGHALAAESGCRLVKVSELDVRFEHNRPLIEAEINGQKVIFLLDTGAGFSTLFGGPAERLGLHAVETGAEAMGVGGGRRIGMVTLQNLKLADANMHDFRMAVLTKSGSANSKEAGILGRDVFGQVETEFDLGAGKVRLFQAKNCPRGQSLAYWTQTPEMVDMERPTALNSADPFKVNLTLNNSHVDAIFDSGAATSVITSEAARRAGVPESAYDSEGKGMSRGIGAATIETHIAHFDQMVLGDETVHRVKLRVGDFFAANTRDSTGSHLSQMPEGLPEMLIGADFFRSHRVLISSSQARVYFTYSGGPVFQSFGAAVKADAPADAKAEAIQPEPAKP